MTELLRRVILAACLGVGLWTFFQTPPALLRVALVDFAKAYDEEYRQRREFPALGVFEQGRKLVAELTDPGSVDGYIAQKTEHRLVRARGPAWDDAAARLSGAGAVHVPTAEAPFADLLPQVMERRAATGYSGVYVAVGEGRATRYIDLTYVDEPATSGAPVGLVRPVRHTSWM
jgi:hypothetical protein